MIRKWDWIREYCNRKGLKEAAEMADQIDRVVWYLYGDANTEEWKRFIESASYGITEIGGIELSDFSVQNGIVAVRGFCIGCECSRGCYECEFAELVGRCDDDGSLYQGLNQLSVCGLFLFAAIIALACFIVSF